MVLDFLLYLLYGLAFFTLGVAILSRDTRLSELGIAKILWLLAVFGIIHGFHEWLELLEQLHPEIKSAPFFQLRLIVVSTSFLFLLYFGLFLNIITLYGDTALKSTPELVKLLFGIAALVLILGAMYFDLHSGNDLYIRRFVAFPGGLLAGIGLIIYSRTVRSFSVKVAGNFILAGICMTFYALFTGIIPSDVTIPLFNIKIILLRGVSAFFIMFFTIRALSVFSLEQRKLINEQLQRFAQSEKLTSMGVLAAGIAHEINNPLTNVSLNLEMLRDQVEGNEQVNRKLDAIERNVSRASTIAKELLHLSREKSAELEPTDLNQVLLSTKNLLQNQLNSPDIQMKLNDIPLVMGAAGKLEELFINLLMNSIDACQKEDRIEIETSCDGEMVQVMITDTGHGIRDEDLSQVFDPFYTTKEIGKGTGLGLSICYTIIKQHGGEISTVTSEHGGTIMTTSFPVITDE